MALYLQQESAGNPFKPDLFLEDDMKIRRMGLGAKLLFGGLLLLILPLFALGSFSIYRASKAMEGLQTEQVQVLRKSVGEQTKIMLEEQIRMLRNASLNDFVIMEIAKTLALSGIKEWAQFNLDKKTTVFHDKSIYEMLLIADETGTIIGDTRGGASKGQSVSKEEYFKRAFAGETVVGKVAFSESGKSHVLIAGPMKSEQNGIIGALIIGWKLDGLIRKMGDVKLGRTGYAFLLDESGRLIFHPDKNMTKGVKAEGIEGMEGIAAAMISLKDGIEETSMEGERKMVAYHPIEGSKWSLGMVVSKKELLAPIESMRNIIVIVGLLGMAAAAGIIFWVVRRMITLPITSVVRDLEQGSDKVSFASVQITSSSQALASGASEQAASIQETSASLEQMASMTMRNAEYATKADDLMKNANRIVRQANESMGKLTDAMGEISKTSAETSKIVKTIDEIAFRTNLLALNAAVEAARAGEAGAGFAVVADEVRNLAMQAADAARNTSDLIEKTVNRISQGSGLVGETSKAFGAVATGSEEVGKLLSEIALASGQQSQGIEQVNKAVSEMDQIVQQNAASAEESAGASEAMNGEAKQMKEIVNKLIGMIGGLAEDGREGDSKVEEAEAQIIEERSLYAKPLQPAGVPASAKRLIAGGQAGIE
ncbi:MAG: methyl-accepting chemotaxis protein [Desulfobacteraceae bacterium]|nr:MAG: methyl-accepting chemotaxis protein [Desulfobacteraceae bacterium]